MRQRLFGHSIMLMAIETLPPRSLSPRPNWGNTRPNTEPSGVFENQKGSRKKNSKQRLLFTIFHVLRCISGSVIAWQRLLRKLLIQGVRSLRYLYGPLEQLTNPPKSRKWSSERKRNRQARVDSPSLFRLMLPYRPKRNKTSRKGTHVQRSKICVWGLKHRCNETSLCSDYWTDA